MSASQSTEIWQKVLENIKEEKKVNTLAYDTWLNALIPIKIDCDCLLLGAPKNFIKEWIEKNYLSLIAATVETVCGHSLKIVINNMEITDEPVTTPIKEKPPEKANKELNKKHFLLTFNKEELDMTLNNKYTFDSFVMGNSNRYAHAASLAVAENPGKVYNPLFIHGGVGLGKTHLMHAIGQKIKTTNPDSKVLYISSEKFTNETINSIRDNSMEKFRQKYRNIDCLLIDDIQFLEKKVATQEEFFHTFNTLYDANKQIVISSDKAPEELHSLEERLISRFKFGLNADITPPDLETRMAILRKKAYL
jgi:chromosomal replication initiator protein